MRAAITDDPACYPWSSCQTHLGLRPGKHLAHHAIWLASGSTPVERAQWWRTFLRDAISDDELTAIHTTLQQQRAFGTTAFQAMVPSQDPTLRRHPPRPPAAQTKGQAT